MFLEALNQITISCINGIETQPDLYFKKYLRNMQVTLVMVLMSLYGTDARQSSADAFVPWLKFNRIYKIFSNFMRPPNSDAWTMKRSLDDLYSICLQSLNQVCQTPINPLQGFTFGKSGFSRQKTQQNIVYS